MAKSATIGEVDQIKNDLGSQNLKNEAGEEFSVPISVNAEKRLVRKIDMMVLPLMVFAYMMAFLDKQTLNYVALMEMREDLHLVGLQYNWSSSVFYFGYLFFSCAISHRISGITFDGQIPSGKISRDQPVHYPPVLLNFIVQLLTQVSMLWAIILACHRATNNFADLMVARFFLGCSEASLSPGFTLITSLWYRTSEQPLRHGIWFGGNSLSIILGNLIAAGIWHIRDGLRPWQWLFIIFAIVTFLWGLILFFRLPDSPTDASFLTQEERLIATEHLKANQTGYKNIHVERAQIFEACTDVMTWLLAVLVLSNNIPNGGFTAFNGLVLKGFGYTTFRTLLLGMSGGAVVLVSVVIGAAISSKLPNSRCMVIVTMNLVGMLGSALVYATSSIASRYAGLLLMGVYSSARPVSMAMISSNVGGFTKRATVNAIYFMYCAGNIIGPQLFFEREEPGYQ
ncbi:hypothetical protein NUU61_007767, partial [Penicillium alfredii]